MSLIVIYMFSNKKCLTIVPILFILFIHNVAYSSTDTLKVYFRLGNPNVDNYATAKLDSAIYYEYIKPGDKLLIVGYTDHLGTNTYNDTLSTDRASNVMRYLVGMGIPAQNISLCIGKGEVIRAIELPEGYATDRRVDIVTINTHSPTPTKTSKRPAETTTTSKKTVQLSKEVIAGIAFDDSVINHITDLPVGQSIVLDKIFFNTGRHTVTSNSIPQMAQLLSVMRANPYLEIRIEGHVCCVHPAVDALDIDTHEIALSVNRAKYIYAYLVKNGIDEDRLSYVGFGKKRPLRRHEFTMEDQDMNKRVEFRIVAQ